MPDIPRMLTIKEAAKETGLAEYHIRRLCKTGEIVAVRTGKKILVNITKLCEYLNTTHAGSPEPVEYGKIRRVG